MIYRGEGSGDERWTYDIDDTRFGGIFLTWDHRTASMYERRPPGSLRGEMGQPREFYVRAGRTLDLTRDTRHNRTFVAQWAKSFEEWVDRFSGEEIDPWDLVESGSMHEYEGTMKPERWIDLVATSLIDHDALVAFDLHGGTPGVCGRCAGRFADQKRHLQCGQLQHQIERHPLQRC